MTQNINLFHAGLRQVRPKLSFELLMKCVGGGLALILLMYAFVQFQVSGLNREVRRVQEQLKAEQSEALKLAGQRSASKPDPQLEAEIAKLQGELRQAQHQRARSTPQPRRPRRRVARARAALLDGWDASASG